MSEVFSGVHSVMVKLGMLSMGEVEFLSKEVGLSLDSGALARYLLNKGLVNNSQYDEAYKMYLEVNGKNRRKRAIAVAHMASVGLRNGSLLANRVVTKSRGSMVRLKKATDQILSVTSDSKVKKLVLG